MTLKEQVAQLQLQNEVLYRALTALLEQNYPYREARARSILTEYELPIALEAVKADG